MYIWELSCIVSLAELESLTEAINSITYGITAKNKTKYAAINCGIWIMYSYGII